MEKIETDKAPKALGPYSQAVIANDLVFCSGQIGIDPSTGVLVEGGIKNETKQVLENLKAVLEAGKVSISHVVKTEVYLKCMDDFGLMNEIYAEVFNSSPQPARVTVEVSRLPKNALVEISCVAVKNNK